MSEDGDDEYTFVYSDVKLESSQGTESDQQGEKEPIDKAEQVEDSEEEERPTLDPMDEEAWQTQRLQKILVCFVDKNGLQ